jgi:pimeloyl-ACP methyl ester carboxylesterase
MGGDVNPLVIIHGWSDEQGSFVALGERIAADLGVAPTEIRLGDWISMNDEVTLLDVAAALNMAWSHYGLPTTPRSVDLIVHSTGALVVREWMTRNHTPQSVPIHRLLMLAPANFGSPLAHKGHSFIGRAIKGWGEPGFQTGQQILKALELGSPYTYELAQKDLFDIEKPWYGPSRILCTVLVGDVGYSGIASIANEDGSDGTVRISTANLRAARITLQLNEKQQPLRFEVQTSQGDIAFGIVAGENHSTIAFKDKGPKNSLTPDLVMRALTVDDKSWDRWTAFLAKKTQGGGERTRYQNTVIRLRDQLGHEVSDYFVELYRTGNSDSAFEQRLYQKFIDSVHPYEDNQSYRSLYLDIGILDKLRSKIVDKGGLFFSFLASPTYVPSDGNGKPGLHPVGYLPVPELETGGVKIQPQQLNEVFAAHRTVLIDAQIHRFVDPAVFRIRALGT